jgi:GNAT superfamily N-acetyltransferase
MDRMNGLRALPGRPSYTALQQEYAHQLEMARTSSAGLIEVPPTPGGYALRQFCPSDEIRYDDLFHLAFEDSDRFSEIRERTLEQGFFVVEHLASRDLVASCVAMRGSSSPRHPEAGQLGWLVTDPSHVGKGLGSIVAASVTNRLLMEDYARPFLGTEGMRTAAISIYLKLGWRPYIYRSEMEARWRSILDRLGRKHERGFLYSQAPE